MNIRDNEVKDRMRDISSGLVEQMGGYEVGIQNYVQQTRDLFRPRSVSDANANSREVSANNREQLSQVQQWFRSDEARSILYGDPRLLSEAEADPVAFYQKMTSNR
jgi:hypothetical protein